ncbi:hypothetical protein Glove_79g68 [Diversispora epigaea]|uniref:PX domain-containing protein n=1 Tax=Diversispora epigaea TaxID=1348612 RepID=A0A397JHH1_9GLOM|nr:hypothetical protein Glove_79g68 [Diversispora epigaea]
MTKPSKKIRMPTMVILEEIPIPNECSIAIKRNLQNFDELRMLCKKLNSERPLPSPSSFTILQKLEDMHSRYVMYVYLILYY